MNVTVLHYHFNRGGVTQVVANHVRALAKSGGEPDEFRVSLLHGGRCEALPSDLTDERSGYRPSQYVVTDLDYDEGDIAECDQLAEQLRAALRDAGCEPNDTVLHVHNHALGKNISLPGALAALARDGYRLLLQIHDFAEDLRPQNYRRLAAALRGQAGGKNSPLAALYPQAPHIHYAVLNRRDFAILHAAGIAETNLHLLPNAVRQFGELPDRRQVREKLHDLLHVPTSAGYIVYPVRGIRRKNLGEALLWAALAADDTVVGVTLAPLNPVEQAPYVHWKKLARRLRLSCLLETGREDAMTFPENLAAADRLITTSVAEGFGMVFLESWLAGRPLVGRDLPEITADFRENGIHFDALYPALPVPVEWLGRDVLRESLSAAVSRLSNDYGVDLREFVDVDRLVDARHIDFAHLDARLQTRTIETAWSDKRRREELLELNPILRESISGSKATPDLAENAAAVRSGYSLEVSGRRLAQLYRRVLRSPVGDDVRPLVGADEILHSFLAASRLHPIRFDP
jgi:glycosyltransferase involved in cell wall biosynthesis